MLVSAIAPRTAPRAVTLEALPKDLPTVEAPQSQALRGHDRWGNWALATATEPTGWSPTTGNPLFAKIEIAAAPTDGGDLTVVKMPKTASLREVVAAAQAVAVDTANYRDGDQAILQSKSGNWYIMPIGWRDEDGWVQSSLPVGLGSAAFTARQSDVVAFVTPDSWVNFSDQSL